MCKKMFCLVAFCLVLVLGSGALADPNTIDPNYEDDFESYTPGNLAGQGPWVHDNSNFIKVMGPNMVEGLETNPVNDSDQYIKFTGSALDHAREKVDVNGVPGTGVYSIQLDIILTEKNTGDQAYNRKLALGMYDANDNYTILVELSNEKTTNELWYRLFNDTYPDANGIKLAGQYDKVQHVTAVVDLDANKAKIVVNNADGAQPVNTGWVTGLSLSSLKSVQLRLMNGTSNTWWFADNGADNFAVLLGEQIRIADLGGRASQPVPSSTVDPKVFSDLAAISWAAGDFVAHAGPNGHDVYFGTDLEDINDANNNWAVGTTVYKGNQDPCSYSIPVTLKWGETYYWRIDEVNNADGNSPLKGFVWQFVIGCPSGDLETDITHDCLVDGKDYSEAVLQWLDETLWPIQP